MRWGRVLVVAALAVGGCGGGDDDGGDAASSAGGSAAGDSAAAAGTDGGEEAAAAAAVDAGAGPASTVAVLDQAQQPSVTAGSVDDNERFEDYLRYRQAFAALGLPVEDLPVEGRHVVTVVDDAGHPVLGADVELVVGGEVVDRARTTADGRVLLFLPDEPFEQLQPNEDLFASVVVEHGQARASSGLEAGGGQTIELAGAPQPDAVQLDLLFLIDATGSMGDEIDRLKEHMTSVAEQVAALPTGPDVRFALTAYRDEGDAFVTRTVDFTRDVAEFTATLADVTADGGGDEPEALNEALGEALAEPSWRGSDTVKLIVLLADAPPQLGRVPSYVDSIAVARADGVKILPIASSDTSAQAEYVFRQLAQATLARFSFLTYGADGASPGTSTPMHVDDYEVLSLDALVVRLVSEELAARA